ncbi:Stp1/IreP family PP2C-type Ser/Thr phosphatase [Clostridium ganghwense]|uniref:Stp1/IreP family PP2C-type Ser/Thr phosphatase n=1 Tax=Clostridium ganghwense TaxID=312089 RepID=A0ABT4CTH9_9CLOT|nr:Stp1/IreP family PP2C-type Ser/Thr phosphatase [Clostridium ganghwense]MCY6372362.1 Stp1/IreP family PP2C-type Ser/Thr phosphatase [Clostridium ganghwense]
MGFNRMCQENCSVGYLSDKGNIREINEDYLGFYEDHKVKLYVIADGMGGHNAGDVASKVAVESCINYIKQLKEIKDIDKVLREAITYANEIVYEKSKANDNLKGMGTTITACFMLEKEVVIANVGDSSCYAVTENRIEKITKDHSLVQELIDDGSITEQEALTHPNKNIITRALGTRKTVEIDIFTRKTDEIQKFILCTDGLTNEVNKKEMYDIILKNDNNDACRVLIEAAKNKGGRDNISVIVFGGECKK